MGSDICSLIGKLCGIKKAAGFDDYGKHSDDSPSHKINTIASPSLNMASRNSGSDMRRRQHEFSFQFQNEIAGRASNPQEARVCALIARIKVADDATFEDNSLEPGQHFHHVHDTLEKTLLMPIARMLPKGSHLHIHFNSTLLPSVLLGYAKEMQNMYIWSDRRILAESDLTDCKLEFGIRNFKKVRADMRAKALESNDIALQHRLSEAERLCNDDDKIRAYDALGSNIFSPEYKQGPKDQKPQVEEMRYQFFRARWDEKAWGSCDEWLTRKLTFSKEEVDSFFTGADTAKSPFEPLKPTTMNTMQHEKPQGFDEQEWIAETTKKILDSDYESVRESARRAWVAFNARTKMMKGLFNYESAFRRYTRKCLEEFVKDNVQYAEIRPNFMQTNQIYNDTAETQINNFGTMDLIVEEYERFMKDIGDMRQDGQIIDDGKHRPAFSGLKVIYCTPRSFSGEAVQKALDECIEMKKKWPGYIAGFDLVGEEAFDKLHPLEYFEPIFRDFRDRCKAENLDIPFLFHCGETPDDAENNLDTALRLGSKRIGHGYALPQKPDILEKMKHNGVCVETCPISNMVLGLAKRMDKHSVYRLLEAGMHCAVSSDNGTLFQSTLSHDFAEVMVGNREFNLYGWKRLARWSIEHSCLSEIERRRTLAEWEKRWQDVMDVLYEISNGGQTLPSVTDLENARNRLDSARHHGEESPTAKRARLS